MSNWIEFGGHLLNTDHITDFYVASKTTLEARVNVLRYSYEEDTSGVYSPSGDDRTPDNTWMEQRVVTERHRTESETQERMAEIKALLIADPPSPPRKIIRRG